MPERLFRYQTPEQLVAIAADLSAALTSGSIQEIQSQSMGYRTRTGPLTTPEVIRRYMDVRYEIFLRGRGDVATGANASAYCAALEPTDPRLERTMRIETYRGGYSPFIQTPTPI
jgi:hypothetical protein